MSNSAGTEVRQVTGANEQQKLTNSPPSFISTAPINILLIEQL